MPSGYITLYKHPQRSFLFYVVANVGPQGSTRPLAVAYRQGHDISPPFPARIQNLVTDILSLIKVLSDPANRTELEKERQRARDWYREHEWQDTDPDIYTNARANAVPDSQQPPFRGWRDEWNPIWQPELPQNDEPREFPFTCSCLVSSLLQGNKNTRTGDVQLQPLSTHFHGDCVEYGMVIIDVSDLDHLKYGIVTFPVRYMADVIYYSHSGEWDPVEDDPPAKEPDTVLVDERPRVPLSILGFLERYFSYMKKDPKVLELEGYPLLDDHSVLNHIWPATEEDTSDDSSEQQCLATCITM